MMMNFYASNPTIASVNLYSLSIHCSTMRAKFAFTLHLIRRKTFSHPLISFYETLTNTHFNSAFERNLTLSKKKRPTQEFNRTNLKPFDRTCGKEVAGNAVLTIPHGFSSLTTGKFKKLLCN
ncbi:hypothetical protein DEG01_002980 [Xanthomonas vasicola]|nr:hypothetical protein KWO_004850 [Xanthomonas vasicola pv. musacearum NCPPB 4379]KFA11801.1 hypothetical protein KWQ_0108610 [Xanthomonas vasicola pv. musacearum NCPPB 4380]KFA24135.1 hypothetical protein KWU_0105740 [Xanthomonas vasicola pv. musacearum NCPPB 4394]RJL84059.1 hypothetical protein DEG03_009400 [Xanthomonas vasicola]RRJ43490.1 hypothetical protein EIM46_03200 [Xanthomonas vasicola pv. musacearum]